MSDLSIQSEKDRLFKAFASVEVLDSQGDLIPMEELEKAMPIYMKRGAPLILMHTNKTIGRVLNYTFKTKNTPVGRKPSMEILGMIFDDYEGDNEAWNGVKSGKYGGISYGGMGEQLPNYKIGDDIGSLVKGLEAYEFSIVDEPANPGADITAVSMAKSKTSAVVEAFRKNLRKIDLQKPFAGYSDFDDCVANNQDADNPEAYCAVIHEQATGKTPAEKVGLKKKVKGGPMRKQEEKPAEEKQEEEEEKRKQDEEKPEEEKQEEEEEKKKQEEGEAEVSVESRLAQVEAAVARIEEMIAATAPVEARKQTDPENLDEDSSGEEVTLPQTEAEDPENAPQSGVAGDAEESKPSEEIVEKAVKQAINPLQKEMRDLKKQFAGYKRIDGGRAGAREPTSSTQGLTPLDIARGKGTPEAMKNFQVEFRKRNGKILGTR